MFRRATQKSVHRSTPSAPRRRDSSARARVLAIGLLASLLAGVPAALAVPGPRGEASLDKSGARVRAELLVDALRVAPGDPVRIGVLLALDPGWHIYWKNPGDSGSATKLRWRAPGSDIGPIEWPAPRVFAEAEGLPTTFGYEGEVLLASDAVVAADAVRSWHLEVDAHFVACSIQCVPGRIRLARAIPVADRHSAAPLSVRERFDLAASRLPRSAESLGLAVAVRASKAAASAGDDIALVLEITSCGGRNQDCRPWTLDAAYRDEAFLPADISDLDFSARGLSRGPATPTDAIRSFSLVLGAHAYGNQPKLVGQHLRGVVPLSRAGGKAHLEFDVPIALDPEGESSSAFAVIAALPSVPSEEKSAKGEARDPAAASALALALALGLLGGLLLNLMPCAYRRFKPLFRFDVR